MRIFFILLIALLATSSTAHATLNVVTTTTDLRALVEEIGGSSISAAAIAKGTQDPHYIEAKPSFMTKMSRADLLISVGLDLEVGWLPSLIQGARNPRITRGTLGYLELGPLLQPIEVMSGKVTRADGDVHPYGNPHFNMDPVKMGAAAILIADRLSRLDSAHASDFGKHALAIKERLFEKTKQWQTRLEHSGVKKVITYHKTLNYFLDRFHLENTATLEPKPGIPPTSGHVLDVINIIRKQSVPLILIENYFDSAVGTRIQHEVPSVRLETVAVSVDGTPEVHTIDDLYEKLVLAIEGKTK